MPRPRFERASPEKRESVLDAAAVEFAAHGYEGASINRILLAAGFSKGAFYYYFDDKADLAAAVLEREALRYLADAKVAPRPSTPAGFWAQMRRTLEAGREQMLAWPSGDALSRLAASMARNPELLARVSGSRFAEITARIEAIWSHGQAIGAVRDDMPIKVLMTLVQGLKMAATQVFLPADRAPTSAEVDTFLQTHFDLVRRVAEPRPKRRRR